MVQHLRIPPVLLTAAATPVAPASIVVAASPAHTSVCAYNLGVWVPLLRVLRD